MSAAMVLNDYTSEEVVETELFRKVLIDSHKECGGSGVRVGEGGAEHCKCYLAFRYVRELLFARIPKAMWGVPATFKQTVFDINGEKVSAGKLFTLDNSVIFGDSVSGKTSLLVQIGKQHLLNGERVVYVTANELVNFLRASEDNAAFLSRMFGADVVLVDDLSKFNRTPWALNELELAIKRMADRGVLLHMALDEDPSALPKVFSKGLANRIQNFNWLVMSELEKVKDMKLKDYLGKNFVDEALSLCID